MDNPILWDFIFFWFAPIVLILGTGILVYGFWRLSK